MKGLVEKYIHVEFGKEHRGKIKHKSMQWLIADRELENHFRFLRPGQYNIEKKGANPVNMAHRFAWVRASKPGPFRAHRTWIRCLTTGTMEKTRAARGGDRDAFRGTRGSTPR
ncbi:hypothetical protein [Sulfidibacter corallicola]|uniref:Uncharacterized protein n=1 Tax=Sulfidibacter corallicola TaxID=2818388 RepID=A0A8A4TI40_SULCO|nr:hypothetical protein [Sulfidibacter corallicola]QTD49283.1 hypothetical protein J3U87_27165 [Sulfidibacter corallicola]